MSDKKNPVNVISINQQGGITANEVNIGQRRVLSDELARNIEDKLGGLEFTKIVCHCAMGDGEGHQFAVQIRDHLIAAGYEVEDFINQNVYTDPPRTPLINPPDGKGVVKIHAGQNI